MGQFHRRRQPKGKLETIPAQLAGIDALFSSRLTAAATQTIVTGLRKVLEPGS